jgi:hypothetical protein
MKTKLKKHQAPQRQNTDIDLQHQKENGPLSHTVEQKQGK